MPAPKEYQGHRSWNAWNVCLYIGNDYGLYQCALDCLKKARANIESASWAEGLPETKRADLILSRAARYFMSDFGGERTPDGGKFNHLAVKLALDGLT